MKKIMLSLGLMFAALTLTNCSNEIIEDVAPEVNGKAFAVTASTPSTRTVADGYDTDWVANDALTIFHVANGTTKYDGSFTTSAEELGIFKGTTTADFTAENTWYAIYPANTYNSSKNPTKTAYDNVGYPATTQKGNNSMAHVAGDYAPLYGITTTAAGEDKVNFTMHHLTTLMKFVVKNQSEEPFTVSSITFKNSAQDFVGTYHLNLTGEKVEYISSGADYVKKEAVLTVTNGEAIAAGSEAYFYLPVKPHTAAVGETIDITVVTDKAVIVRSKEVATATEFAAGKVNAMNITATADDFAQEEVVYVENAWNLVNNAYELAAGQKVIIAASGYNFAMSTTQNSNNRGIAPIAKGEGTATVRDDVQVFTVEAGSTDGTWAFKTSTGYIYAASSSSNHLKTQSTKNTNASWSVTIVNGVASVVAQGSNTRNVMQYNNESGLFSCYSSASQKPIAIYLWVGDEEPALSTRVALATPQNVTAAVEEGTNSVTFAWDAVENAVSYTVTAGTKSVNVKTTTTTIDELGWNVTATASVVANADANSLFYKNSEAGTVEYTIGENPDAGEDVALGESYSYSFTKQVFTANGTKALGAYNWTLAGNGGYWGWDSNNGKGQQFGSSGKPYKSMTLSTSDYEGGINKIVINTSGASRISATCTVTVGGVQIGKQIKLTTSATDHTFESEEILIGEVVISYSQTSSKAIYIKSIAIN